MSDYEIRVSGDDTVTARLARLAAAATEAQRAVIRPLGTDYLSALMDEAPVGKGPAEGRRRLHQAFRVQERYGATSSYRISNDSPHLRYVLRGRGPIVAKPGKMLRFEILGQVYFRKRVGPAAANNFPPRARRRVAADIAAAPRRIVEHIVRAYQG